jgi:hypothetical protein
MPIRKTMYRVSWLDENGQEIIDEVNRAAVDTLEAAKQRALDALLWDDVVLSGIVTQADGSAIFYIYPSQEDYDANVEFVTGEQFPHIKQWNEKVED